MSLGALWHDSRYGTENHNFGEIQGQIEILSTHNLPCLQLPAPPTFLTHDATVWS